MQYYSTPTKYMLIKSSMYRNIHVEATKIVDIMQRENIIGYNIL